jgi:hypothetical protein
MPYYHFKQIPTPLILFNIRFFKDQYGGYWFKAGRKPRRQIINKRNEIEEL